MNLDGLNDMQKRAVKKTDGPLLIIAGAGSGKTRVLTHRIAYLIEDCDVAPYNILAITFTNKAAAEMKERVEKITPLGSQVWVSTFHSTCVRILRRYIDRLGYDTNFTIYDTDDQKSVIKEACKKLNIDTKMLKERTIMSAISRAKDELVTPDEMEINAGNDYNAKRIAGVYREYQKMLKTNNALDFDDLIFKTVELFKQNEDILFAYQERFRYIMVDEYQDTNTVQFKFVSMLAGKYGNLCVVGDDDQSIYGFRGADSSIFKEFSRKYPGSVQIILGTNYRSLPYIIEGADKVIRNNENRIVKNMSAYRQGEGKVHIRQTASYGRQADMAVSLINDYVKTGGHLSDIAILYRVKKEASVLVNTLETIGMPFFTRDNVDDIHLGICFYDMLAYYRLSRGVPEQTDLRRIINRPKRYIRSNLVHNCEFDRNKIYEACIKNASRQDCLRINDTINDMFLDFRSLSRIDNPTQFINYIYDDMGYENDLFEYAEYTGLDSGDIINQSEAMKKEALKFDNMSEWYRYITDREYRVRTDKNEGVYLSTFHGAKGLQWKKVIIISANEQVTPYAYMGKVDDYEEERRLFYVAMTRAEDELDIIYIDGGARHQKRSRYVQELITV